MSVLVDKNTRLLVQGLLLLLVIERKSQGGIDQPNRPARAYKESEHGILDTGASAVAPFYATIAKAARKAIWPPPECFGRLNEARRGISLK